MYREEAEALIYGEAAPSEVFRKAICKLEPPHTNLFDVLESRPGPYDVWGLRSQLIRDIGAHLDGIHLRGSLVTRRGRLVKNLDKYRALDYVPFAVDVVHKIIPNGCFTSICVAAAARREFVDATLHAISPEITVGVWLQHNNLQHVDAQDVRRALAMSIGYLLDKRPYPESVLNKEGRLSVPKVRKGAKS